MLWTSGLQHRCSPSLQTPLSRPCSHRPAVFQRAQHLLASRPQVRQRAHAVQPVFAKAKQAEEDAAPEAMASLKFKKGSTHKFRRILDQIRGRSYEEALMILEFLPHRACDSILPTLISAAANAKENLKMSKLNLYISECYADEAPKLKRFTNGYKGRPYKILKGVSHVTIKVKERKQAGKSIAAAAAKELAPEAM
ncbi:hypothetical protein CVIRNUC_005462 [Coccomyxa viridis]|uniref:Large ribosomal subunit protein uL22c n=1 Tax=Coccomyxa viridis TaxID=1274662 RepID=A0AAV1I8K4_9CHLO|nr:hypothetical protein CVIRNUC_005462 [Coccomyxa viridis]